MSDIPQKEALITFLAQTKDGKFAEIPQYTLDYIRMDELTETSYEEEEYIYSYC